MPPQGFLPGGIILPTIGLGMDSSRLRLGGGDVSVGG